MRYLLSMFVIILMAISGSQASAETLCTTKKEAERLFAGKWVKFTFKENGRTRKARIRYHKNGKTTVVTDSGLRHTKGTWRRKGNTIYRYAPARPGRARFKVRIKKSC